MACYARGQLLLLSSSKGPPFLFLRVCRRMRAFGFCPCALFAGLLCAPSVYSQSTPAQGSGAHVPQNPRLPVVIDSVPTRVTLDPEPQDAADRHRQRNQPPVASRPSSSHLPAGTLLTDAEFADVTAVAGPNVAINLFGQSFTVGMKADFEGMTYDVALTDTETASIRVNLPADFDISATHQVRLKTSTGGDGGFQYLSNQLIPRGDKLTAAVKADRLETKELAKYAKATRERALAQKRANEAQHKLNVAEGIAPRKTTVDLLPITTVVNPTCHADNGLELTNIRVRRSVMSPKEASDAFGRRLGRHYIIYQVTVENRSGDYQYMLHNVSVDLSALVGAKQGSYEWSFSTQELSMLRGVPEKGQDYDPRNISLHILRGVGTVAGGVSGLTAASIQDVFAGAVAGYNGPFLSSFLDIFPDHTATQLNRLSDSAFTANSIVAKRAAKVFAIFVPSDLLLTNGEALEYWRHPLNLMSDKEHDFRRADVCVDGTFITEVSTTDLASVEFADQTLAVPGASVDLLVRGSNLVVGETTLRLFDQTVPLTSIDSSKGTATATVQIPASYDFQRSYPALLESSKTGSQSETVNVGAALKPVLTDVEVSDPATAVAGAKSLVLLITGAHLTQETSLEIFSNEAPLTEITADGTSARATVAISDLKGYDPTKPVKANLKTKSGLVSADGELQAQSK